MTGYTSNSKGDLKERFKTRFNELDISKGKLLFESSDNKLYTIYDTENKKWCYVLMQKDANKWEYFYVKNIFNGIVSDLNLKNGMVDIIKDGYAEAYQNPYPVSLDSWSPIEEKGYYKNNKKNGIWIINYLHQIYSKIYYIRGVPICYWDYDGYDHLTEFGIYIYSKKIKIRRKKYFYGLSS